MGPSKSAKVTESSSQAVRVDTLKSGLTVMRVDRPGWPVVTADVWVATGSAWEAPEQAGISHFLEHMVFKGTERRGPGELDRLVEGVGGHWNAGTSKDFTHYYLTLPSEHRSLALDALSDAVLHSVIDPEEVERERQVILEEWRRSEDNPAQTLHTRLYETSFAEGPYRWPVIGTRETINAISREQLATYHRGRYRPERMALILAGPVGDDAVLEGAEELFQWPSDGPDPGVADSACTWRPGGVRNEARPVQEVYLAVSWPGPSAENQSAMLAMDVAQFILGQGRASRLYQRLHEEERVVTTVSAVYPAHARTGVFTVVASCEPQRVEAARESIVREVTALAAHRPNSAEVARARRLLTNQHIFGRETTSGHTASLGLHHTLTGDPTFDERYGDLVAKVTAASVTRWAKEFLGADAATTVAIHPADHAPPWGEAA